MFKVYPQVRHDIYSLEVGDRMYGGRILSMSKMLHGHCIVNIGDGTTMVSLMIGCFLPEDSEHGDIRYSRALPLTTDGIKYLYGGERGMEKLCNV